jgi:ABC-type glycerol-3-phosphate transport system substrate-binding protein
MSTRDKKSLSRRQFLIGAGLISAAATLAACGAPAAPAAPAAEKPAEKPAEPAAVEEKPAEPAPAEEKPAEEPAPAAEPTAAVGEYGSGGTPTVIWHGLGGADGAVFATMLQTYAKDNNTSIRSETYNWDVFFQKFPTAVAAGTPPDWTIFHAAEVPQMATQGVVIPLDDVFYKANSIGTDDFSPAVMSVLTHEGKVMAVPFDNHGWSCYVNTKVIKNAGLDPEKLPANGQEFIDWALKIVVDEAGKHPNEDGFNPDKTKVWALDFSWPRFTMPSTWFQFQGGKAGQFEDKTAKLNSEKSVAAVQYWHDLMYKYKVVRPALPGLPWSGDLMKTDAMALWWDGTWSLGFFKDNPELEAVTKAVPLNSLAPDGFGAQKIDSHIMAIPTGAKDDQIERAVKLMAWLSNNGKTWATSGQIPARLSVQKDPDVQAIWSVKAAAEAFNKQGFTEAAHPAFIELQTAWETAVGAALSNTEPLKEALDKGNDAIQAILDRA